MPHLKITNGKPEAYSIRRLREDNPGTSFPEYLSDTLLADWGVYPYAIQDVPDYDRLTQTAKVGDFAEVVGAWTQGWEISNLAPEDAATNIRNRRDALLSQTDWMGLNDVIMEPYWLEYRQQLRDVTAQDGFPFNVVWPTKP
tara:strand:+ start:4067 stop:4492 length:426 start_codon:yes stop_codon:yes gene_type:complete